MADPNQPANTMTPLFSIYLNAMRFLAAFVVLIAHIWPFICSNHPLPWPGHQAVIVFFVISGYVIAHVTAGRESTFRAFAAARVARIVSVAWPALLLAMMACAFVIRDTGMEFAPAPSTFAMAVRDTLANAVFLGQNWTFQTVAPLNTPYWSLNYEVWYYAIFAAFTFARNSMRWLLTVTLAVLAGPAIMTLFPCWLAGVWLYRARVALPARWAGIGFAASVCLWLPYFWFDLGISIRAWMVPFAPALFDALRASNTFAGDYILTGIIVLNFSAVMGMTDRFRFLTRAGPLFGVLSSYTFSFYLYHAPVFAILWNDLGLRSWLVVPVMTGIIVGYGYLTEHRLLSCLRAAFQGRGHEKRARQLP